MIMSHGYGRQQRYDFSMLASADLRIRSEQVQLMLAEKHALSFDVGCLRGFGLRNRRIYLDSKESPGF